MSDETTYSWQIESKSGVNTRVDGVRHANAEGDTLALSDADGSPLFYAALSSLSFAKRVDPHGKASDQGRSIAITVPAGMSAVEAVAWKMDALRAQH